MEKKWYKSKTMWTGVFAVVYAIYSVTTTGIVDSQEVFAFLSGTGLIGMRDAVN